ncbi:MAG TPA: lytic transglycosylase domain-containing protein [Solirubrobacteraceae bacterium]
MSAEPLTPFARRRVGATTGLGVVATGLLLGVLAMLGVVGAITGASLAGGAGEASVSPVGPPSALAVREIPPQYLSLYEQAAQRYGLDWAILAGIGKVECDHGRDVDLSCAREGSSNAAGAGGPMQFLAATWTTYGVDGDGDGRADRWDPADAIWAAANYLSHAGAPADYSRAIYAYNHAGWYVERVEQWAARYRGSTLTAASQSPISLQGSQATGGGVSSNGPDLRLQAETTTPVNFVAGERAQLSQDDGHQALIPAGVPAVVEAMLVAGNELQDLPYGPDGHPDPRGALEEDCSSTVNYVLYRSGIRPIAEIVSQNPLAQDYTRWGVPGPGRWVTIYATTSPTDHTFIVIAGLRLDTSHDGTDTGPNRGEDGPRWRILDHIPTWAHWSVRHPPGL